MHTGTQRKIVGKVRDLPERLVSPFLLFFILYMEQDFVSSAQTEQDGTTVKKMISIPAGLCYNER